MLIRAEKHEDYEAVRAVITPAFETPAEANLMEVLQKEVQPVISLVAQEEGHRVGMGAGAVLGHTRFYPRFGFIPLVELDIRSEYNILEDVFMVVELFSGYLKGASGMIKYPTAFTNV